MNGNEPKNFIEINGNKYDASTGRLIDGEIESTKYAPNEKTPNLGVVDGIVRRPGVIYKPETAEKKLVEKPKQKHDLQISSSVRKPQKSKTLMRPAVKKPQHVAPESSSHSKAKRPVVSQSAPHARLKRAQEVKKSEQISRFKPMHAKSSVVKKTAVLPVAHKTIYSAKPVEDIAKNFEHAIENATSHLQTYVGNSKKSGQRKKFAMATISLSILLVGGAVLYQAVPAAKIKVAGTKAGFSASLPSYSPAGFGLNGSVKSHSGEVQLNYSSRTDDKNYRITQSPSSWNSQSLANNFLLASDKAYQTYESNGKTVYIYDGSNATWVDGGIWYNLEGNASLTSDQLLRIASGL